MSPNNKELPESLPGRLLVGVDVGGTFTDVFFFDPTAADPQQACGVAKVPSTRGDQSRGILEGVRRRAEDLASVATLVHGTTVGTNALLERKGARTGVITTAGFRDVLEMRRRDRPKTWGLWGGFEPVVPRDLRLEVPERTLADGTVHTAVDLDAVREATRQLLAGGAEAVSVIFVNSYANPQNEHLALEAVREVWPDDHVNASSEILPEIREFERASTTALNAYLQPAVGSYLERLESGLREGGLGRGASEGAGDILIVQSNGGVMTVETARQRPVRTALSGPAAGVIAAGVIAGQAGFPNVVTCDMGGTSFDVSLIADGESVLAAQTSIDFGLVIRTPMIEITTIGAGGGSIAWVDAGGMLQIGPESAGSDPGPVCYGLGNDLPTVTDANVLLGRINAERPIGGKLDRLDMEGARRALTEHVGEPLGLDAEDAAEAVLRVANSRMAGAIRLVSVERGYDPERFVAMPFGGGGSLHACALIRDVGLDKALVPRYPGVTSALGCVLADMRHDFVQTVNRLLDSFDEDGLDVEALETERRSMITCGETLLDEAGVPFAGRSVRFEMDMSYLGQTHTVAVPLHSDTALSHDAIRRAFDERYREVYGRLLEGLPVRILNLRGAVIGHREKLDLSVLAPPEGSTLEDARRGSRSVRVDGVWRDAAVYARLELPIGGRVPGPSILEQPDTTIFIEPGMEGEVDRFGNLLIVRSDEASEAAKRQGGAP